MKRIFNPVTSAAVALYLFLYLPLLVIILQSFNQSRYSSNWAGFTTSAYRAALSNNEVLAALKNTLVLAVISTAVSTVIGTLLGYGLARHNFPFKRTVGKSLLLPIAVPDIVMAVSLLLFYSLIRSSLGIFHLSITTMVIAHVTFQIPFVVLVIQARLRGLDPSLEEAASDLGASRSQRLRHVTLPLLRPGILAAALLAFTLSLDDFVVSFFTSGPGAATVPIYIYATVKRGVTAEIHALSSLLIFAGIVGTIGITLLQSRNQTRS